ncbi:MAG TPA: hypothetical protein VFH37_02680 [Candidatus Saccharimonadales bacterium]|nr:hypothetical protein [Candidatus Saccharimonadales bacterium]
MKLPKLNQKGITHILAPIAFIGVFSAIGGAVMLRSHAAATMEYIGGQVRLNSSTGSLVQNATVTLRPYGGNTTQYTYTNNPSAPGFYEFPNKIIVGDTYVMSAYKVINNVRYCSGHKLVTPYYIGGTNPLFIKNFIISKQSFC